MVHSQQSLLAWALRRPMPHSQLSVDACHKARQAHAAQLGLPWHLAAARWSPGRPTRAQLWAQPIANQLLQNNFEGVARLEDLEPPAWFHAFRSELIHELLISHSASHGQELVQYTWPVQHFRIPWVCVFDGDLAYMKPLKAAKCLMTDDKPEAPVGITSAGGGESQPVGRARALTPMLARLGRASAGEYSMAPALLHPCPATKGRAQQAQWEPLGFFIGHSGFKASQRTIANTRRGFVHIGFSMDILPSYLNEKRQRGEPRQAGHHEGLGSMPPPCACVCAGMACIFQQQQEVLGAGRGWGFGLCRHGRRAGEYFAAPRCCLSKPARPTPPVRQPRVGHLSFS